MDLPSTYAAELALNRQNIALSVIKASADSQAALANILDQAVRSAPISQARGTNVNISA